MSKFFRAVCVVAAVTASFASAQPSGHGKMGKSTYAMSHPFAWKAFMEKYFDVAENIVQANSTDTCVEWVKLCILDGTSTACSTPMDGTVQLHSVGAYERYSGAMSMQQLESAFTQTLGGMKTYSPFMELHAAFYTLALPAFASSFLVDNVPVFHSTFVAPDTGKTYSSLIVQTAGSLDTSAGSMVLMELIGPKLEGVKVDHHHDLPRSDPVSLAAAENRVTALPKLKAGSKALSFLHVSFATSDLARDVQYYEKVLGGQKAYGATSNLTADSVYYGKLMAGDTTTVRYFQSGTPAVGPLNVTFWENYQTDLHKKCIIPTTDEGFDRLADFHWGHALPGASVEGYITRQKAAGLPYRLYRPPTVGTQHFLYLYGPAGWGAQLTGTCTDTSICPVGKFYNFCTQGVTGSCSKDLPSDDDDTR